MITSRYDATPPRTAKVIDDEDDLYSGFNEVAPALDTRNLRDDQAFQQVLRTAGIGRPATNRLGTGIFRVGTVSVRGASRAGTAARPVTAVRAAGYTSSAKHFAGRDSKKEETIEDKIKQMELKIMTLVEESCVLSAQKQQGGENESKRESDLSQALAKAQEASTLERQLIRMQEQANMGDSHNLDLTFAVLCNLADQYALNEMYAEALNTYQLLTRNRLFPHANRLKVNMGNIYFKMGEHPKALKLYRMALDQTPTAEKDLRMKVMHNIGLLLVRMGKFRDAVTNFQHIMQEQGDFQTGLHLVLCSVALDDVEGGKAAFHAMLDVEPPTYHHDIAIDDEEDAFECVVRDVVRGDRLSAWSRAAAARADTCLVRAAAALARPTDAPGGPSWCVEALRGYSGGGAGARLELGSALAALRSAAGTTGTTGYTSASNGAMAAGTKALQRLKAVARAHPDDRILRAEANADAAFVAFALGRWSESQSLSEAAARDDPYSCVARVTGALASLAAAVRGPSDRGSMERSDSVSSATERRSAGRSAGRSATQRSSADRSALDVDHSVIERNALESAAEQLTAASHLDPTDLVAMYDTALVLEQCGAAEGASARLSRVRGAAGGTLRALSAAALARLAAASPEPDALATAEHWYSMIGNWDASVTCALAQLHADAGDAHAAKHHYQDVEAVWPCDVRALRWLAGEAPPDEALQYYRRAARLQPDNPQWGLLMGGCLRASGRYQEALALYKNLNSRFPDNVHCLKLIVKLCGDQGLSETSAWSRELQRAQARAKQHERTAASVGSGSSGASQSPVDRTRGGSSELRMATASKRPASRTSGSSAAHTYSENYQESMQPVSRPLQRSQSRKKTEDFDDDLPLPPE
ncbi:intraflagellar transport protein 88 homolog [Aricia agestis]|uniref:intraflagellar transport protein 88 homolog n=1 Tax=Aricia agestis TaxID=91739 RepID=UPI001C20671E|nr:intraflagellar transport protein 88 homolog [Aricia agestis]